MCSGPYVHLFIHIYFPWEYLKVKCTPLNRGPQAMNMEDISAIPEEIMQRIQQNLPA